MHNINNLNIYLLDCTNNTFSDSKDNLIDTIKPLLKNNSNVLVTTIFVDSSNIDFIINQLCKNIKKEFNICITDIAIDKIFKPNPNYDINLIHKITKIGRKNRTLCKVSTFRY